MPWFKVDDRLHSHPKWTATPATAKGLWVTAGSWCADHSHAGIVPSRMVAMFGFRTRDAVALVASGLWEEHAEGWQFHDWEMFQPSPEQVERGREAARQRQRKARQSAASRRDIAVTHAEVTPVVTVPPTRPDPNPLERGCTTGSPGTAARRSEPPMIEEVGDDGPSVDYEHHDRAKIPTDIRALGKARVVEIKTARQSPHLDLGA